LTGRRLGLVVLLGTVGVLATAGTAGAATVENGAFERGDLSGWKQDFFGPGAWSPYEGVFEGGDMRGPVPDLSVPAPPQGTFGAISDQGEPSAMFISQKVRLRANRRHRLRFKLAYSNRNFGTVRGTEFGPGFFTPNHFRFGKAARPNQQFRVDVMKPGASIKSLKDKDVLEQVYITERGDARRKEYRTVTANLTGLAGKTVRLRFAVVVTESPLNVGVDAVKVKTKPLG